MYNGWLEKLDEAMARRWKLQKLGWIGRWPLSKAIEGGAVANERYTSGGDQSLETLPCLLWGRISTLRTTG